MDLSSTLLSVVLCHVIRAVDKRGGLRVRVFGGGVAARLSVGSECATPCQSASRRQPLPVDMHSQQMVAQPSV